MWIIYHNQNCSKSNAAFDLLKEKNIDFTIINYLDNPLSFAELQILSQQLNHDVESMIRKKDAGFLAIQDQWDNWTEDQKLTFLSENIALLERPIVVNANKKAKVGRPDHTVLLELFEEA